MINSTKRQANYTRIKKGVVYIGKVLYPNQRSITIHKSRPIPGQFSTINNSATLEAMKTLSYSGYMLYSYLSLNANLYDFSLSMEALRNQTAFKRNTYYNAFHELEEKKYLVRQSGYTSRYDFYERPKSGRRTPKKQDDTYQKTAENINNNIEENKNTLALPLDAPGGAQPATIPIYDF